MKEKILAIKDLEVRFLHNAKVVEALRGLTLDVFSHEVVAVVGEQNSGKSVLLNAITNQLTQNGWISGGEIVYTPPTSENDKKIDERLDIVESHRNFLYQDTIRDVRRFYAMQIEKLAKEIKTIETLDVDQAMRDEEMLSRKLDKYCIKNDTKKSNRLGYLILQLQYEISRLRKYVYLYNNKDERDLHLAELIQKIEDLKSQAEKIREISYYDKLILRRLVKIINSTQKGEHVWDDDEIFLFQKYFMRHEKLNDVEEIIQIVGQKQQTGEEVLEEEYHRLKSKWRSVSRWKFINRANAERELSKLRGSTISIVYKDSKNQLNPLLSVGRQIADVLRKSKAFPSEQVEAETIKLLERVGIQNAQKSYRSRPSKFSIADRQRICFAIAVASRPRILLCDEPVSNLDPISKVNISRLLLSLKDEYGLTVIATTHDIRNVVNGADRIAIIYAGQIVEVGTTKEIFTNSQHPYTWSILMSLSEINPYQKNQDYILTGDVPDLSNSIIGDAFAPRNKFALKIDWMYEPPTFKLTDTHFAKTWLLDYRSPKVERPKELENVYKILAKVEKGE